MNGESKNDPGKKLRNLLGAAGNSPIKNLPKKEDPAPSFLPLQDESAVIRTASHSAARPVSSSKGSRSSLGPPFWTIASIISLAVNGILVVVVIGLLFNMQRFDVDNVLNLGNSFLGGLYTNFEKMD